MSLFKDTINSILDSLKKDVGTFRNNADISTLPILRIMNSDLVFVSPEATVKEACIKMKEKKVGSTLVIKNEKVLGIFTERDLLNKVITKENGINKKITEYMTPNISCIKGDESVEEVFHVMQEKGIRHLPIKHDGKVVGIISLKDILNFQNTILEKTTFDISRKLAYTKELLDKSSDERLKVLIDTNKKLKELSITDELTGLYNHRYFQMRLADEVDRARRYKYPVALIFLDIDYFKFYNDTNGHVKGDSVLEKIGSILQNIESNSEANCNDKRPELRRTDIAARYGGEEFVILLPYCNLKNGIISADRIRQTIEETVFENQESQPNKNLTASFGVSCYPEESSDRFDLLKKADEALYVAKDAGRNLVKTL